MGVGGGKKRKREKEEMSAAPTFLLSKEGSKFPEEDEMHAKFGGASTLS